MGSAEVKYELLLDVLRRHKRLAVAFSGGVDSTFLLKAARDVLGNDVLAVTARSVLFPEFETRETVEFCEAEGIEQVVIDVDSLAVDGFCENPTDRCYICKYNLFEQIIHAAREHGFDVVAEGTNASDADDYRPGVRALGELGVWSLLREVGLTKSEIREHSEATGLPTWNKPSYACLASRIPYGEEITEEKLLRVGRAEQVLRDIGFEQVRVREQGETARIEVSPEDIGSFMDAALRESVIHKLKALGFAYVTLDLEGYRTGSLNEIL